MTTWEPTQPIIGHLKVHYGEAEINAIVLRQRVERLLNSADLRPAGLSGGAVLIVSKLQALTPLSITAQVLPTDWTTHLHEQLKSLYATAARPAHGPVAASAASVLFADPAEMLACLSLDLLRGQARERWYWQHILRNVPSDAASALTTLWCSQATFVPATLNAMTQTDAWAAIATLSTHQISAITQALHIAFALPAQPATMFASSPIESARTAQLYQSPVSKPPWQPWLTTSPPGLSPQAYYLLGLTQTLQHAPAFARSTRFMTQIEVWLYEILAAPSQKQRPLSTFYKASTHATETIMPTVPDENTTLLAHKRISNNDMAAILEQNQMQATRVEQKLTTAAETENNAESTPTEIPSVAASSQTENALPTSESSASSIAANRLQNSTSTNIDGSDSVLPEILERLAAGVPTELGGVCYLINLLSWLNLPACWDNDGTLAEHIGAWSIIEALARGLLAASHAHYADDPLWNVLIALDRRETGIPVGATLPQQDAFRLPGQWLRRYSPTSPHWLASSNETRLFLYEENGSYLVVDAPLAGRSLDEAVRAEIEAYQMAGVTNIGWHISTTPHAPLPLTDEDWLAATVSQSAGWWLQRVLGFISYLLLHALQEDIHTTSLLPDRLFCYPGRLLVSRTHIDLFMDIEQISLPIRRVGLDRDPGWMPDLGYIVLFHFE